jgi:predicted GIY-YIG superfamily endonuclease
MQCGESVSNPNHDLCYDCFTKKEDKDSRLAAEDHFESSLTEKRIYTIYIMFYQNNEKIGYTNDLNSRIIEIKRQFPNNRLVYFREFSTESEARRFEAWLKNLSKREITKFIADFQDKLGKVDKL